MKTNGRDLPLSGRKPWVVVGRIIGRHLPKREIQIGRFSVGPPRGESIERISNVDVVPTNDWHFTASVGDVRVKSRCYLWIVVESTSAQGAIDTVRDNELPALVVSLSSRFGGPTYRTELLWAEDGATQYGAFSPGVGATHFTAQDLLPDDAEGVGKLCGLISANTTATQAASMLVDARYQLDTCQEPAQIEGALLGYFKVIELIAKKVAGEIPPSPDIDDRRKQIVSSLREVLSSPKTDWKKAIAISDAHRALERLERRYLQLQIAAAANHLQLGTVWQDRAETFMRLRHQKLGHAGATTSAAERAPLLNEESDASAQRLALTLLIAYVTRASVKP